MIKANTSSAVSNLGGGAHGLLGLIIPELEYSKIKGTIYTKLVHSSKLKIEENTTLYDAIILWELHKLQTFWRMTTVEAVLKSQIVATINPMHLREIENSTIETIIFTIPYIFTYLFQR